MSYKVLIADDEIEVREGLKLKVDWEQSGFQISGEAANGLEAELLLKQKHFDLLITDMNMPVMDGIGLLELCREMNPAPRIMIVTGYEDFRYARAGMRSKAVDYLLKPVTREDLRLALARIREELDQERASWQHSELMSWRLTQNYKELKERFLYDLARGSRLTDSSLRERLRLFHMEPWQKQPICFLAVGLAQPEAGMKQSATEQYILPFELICQEIAQQQEQSVLTFRDPVYPGMMHFIILDGWQETVAAQLQKQVRSFLGLEAVIGIGQTALGIHEWKNAHLKAWLACNMSHKSEPRERVSVSDNSNLLPEEASKVLQRYLLRGEIEAFRAGIRRELDNSFAVSPFRMRSTIFQITLLLESTAADAGLMLPRKEQLWSHPEWMLWLESPQQAEEVLLEWTQELVSSLAKAHYPEQSMIESARRYIDENYMHELTLTAMAERYNYHPTYFSEMFKAEAGSSFIQYVTEVRMKHAVDLLRNTQLSVWDIAELIGMSSPSYFSSKFKKMYGISPSEFRLTHSSEKSNTHDPKK